MVHSVIYAMRGWIAFVAFIDFSNSIQCYIDGKRYVENLFTYDSIISPVMVRLLWRYFLLNGIINLHCALFIHHLPIISLSICSLALSTVFYVSESMYYYSAPLQFNVIFPVLISFSTIICLIIAPLFIEEEPKRKVAAEVFDDEDDEIEFPDTTFIPTKRTKNDIPFINKRKKFQ